jgi:hypothetical protein
MKLFHVVVTIGSILIFFIIGVVYTFKGDIGRACLALLYFCSVNQLVGGWLAGQADYYRQKKERRGDENA